MDANLLHVVAVYANPIRWRSRLALHLAFEKHMLASGVQLTTVECAYGERPFDLPPNPDINRVQVRAKTLVWNKENLINIGVSRLPSGWKYLLCSDADIFFRKPNWAVETVHALQQYDVIQPWSDAYDLGPNDEHLQAHKSFCRQLWEGHPVAPNGSKWWKFSGGPYDYPHSGYAWAYTRQAYEWLGGLIETGVLGSGDHHMALALVNRVDASVPAGVSAGYMRPLLQWQQRAQAHIRHIGFIWCTIEHGWHGRKIDRHYESRWGIITENGVDPDTDLKRNSYGVFELVGNKPQLITDIDHYFRKRNEDLNGF